MDDLPESPKFASTARVDEVADIVHELMEKVLNWNTWYFISDESSLFDFPTGEIYRSDAELFAKIQSEFGVDVSDIEDANIARICECVRRHRNSH